MSYTTLLRQAAQTGYIAVSMQVGELNEIISDIKADVRIILENEESSAGRRARTLLRVKHIKMLRATHADIRHALAVGGRTVKFIVCKDSVKRGRGRPRLQKQQTGNTDV